MPNPPRYSDKLWIFSRAASAISSGLRSKTSRSLRRNTLGRRHVLGRIDVEERVDRARRPVGNGDAMARGPDLDLVQALDHQRLAQVLAQRHRPQPHHRMPPVAGARAGERRLRPLRAPQRAAPPGRPAGTGSRPARWRCRRCPAHAPPPSRGPARMPASGPAKSGTLSATTGRRVSAKRAGSPLALMIRRAHCGVMRRQHALEDGLAADRDARLVAAAHAAREPAGEDEAERRRGAFTAKARARAS